MNASRECVSEVGMTCKLLSDPLTADDALKLAEMVADEVGNQFDRSFTESEEAHLAVSIWVWMQQMNLPTSSTP